MSKLRKVFQDGRLLYDPDNKDPNHSSFITRTDIYLSHKQAYHTILVNGNAIILPHNLVLKVKEHAWKHIETASNIKPKSSDKGLSKVSNHSSAK